MPAHLLNFFIFSGALILSWVVGAVVPPTWTVSQAVLDVHTDSDGRSYYIARGPTGENRARVFRGGSH